MSTCSSCPFLQAGARTMATVSFRISATRSGFNRSVSFPHSTFVRTRTSLTTSLRCPPAREISTTCCACASVSCPAWPAAAFQTTR